MCDIIVAGNMIVDLIKKIDTYPQKLSLVAINQVDWALGGAVCNVLIGLARLDSRLKLAAIGYVGTDEYGAFVLEQMARYPSIDLSAVKRHGQTSFTDVMTIEATGERTFFTYKGADNLLTTTDFSFQSCQSRLMHFGYILLLNGMDAEDKEYGTVMAHVMHDAQQAGILTSVDVVSEDSDRFKRLVPPSLRYTDYCTVNEYEAEKITGVTLRNEETGSLIEENMALACEKLRGFGVRRWITIHTPEGAFGLDEQDIYSFAPSLPLPKGFIQGSVGAGDAFVAGLLYEANRGSSHKTAMETANAVAACSLSQADSTSGIRSYEDTLCLMKEYR